MSQSFWILRINYLLFILVFSILGSYGHADPGVTYHGQIIKPNGQPVEGQFVGFRIRVMDGLSGSCVMYEETHTKDMRNSNGAFAIAIGDGSVIGTYNVSGVTFFDEIFRNGGTFNFLSPAGCVGSPYSPDSRAGRKLNVEFRESPTDAWEAMPVMNIAYVPFAYNSLVSRQVGDHTSGSLLRVESGGVPSAATALTPANFTELLALLNGSTTQYVKTVSGTAGQVTVSTTSGAATVGLADVATVTAGTYGSATQVPVFTVDAKGRVTSVTNTLITGAGGGITQLTGDVTASGTGSVSATIANDAITTVKILDNAVTGPKLAASAVGSAAIAEGAVTTGKLADGSVTNVKLANLAVDTAKLAADAVTSAKIQNGTITGDDLAATASLNIASVSATGNVGAETMSSRLMALYEQSVNGTDYVGLKAPDNMTTGFVVFTLPGADGTAGQVLRTDGSGNLSWVNAATGAGDLMADGSVPMTGQLRFIGGSAGTPGLGVVGDTNTGIFSPGADSLAVTTGGTERFVVSSTGIVTVNNVLRLGASSTGSITSSWDSGANYIQPLLIGNTTNSMIFRYDSGADFTEYGTGAWARYDRWSRGSADGHQRIMELVAADNNHYLDIYDPQTTAVAVKMNASGSSYFNGGNVGVGTTNPTAALQIKAGTTAAGTAPLKLTAGPVLSSPEAGAIEFDGTSLFYTDSGNTRRTLGVAGAGITALTGDVLASGVGSAAAVIANDAITTAKILDGTIATADLADDSVTFAKFQNIASGSILGRASSSAGNVEELTLGTGLTLTGTVLSATASDTFAGLPCGNGYVPYRSAGAWGCREATASKVNDSIVSRDSSGNFIAGSGTFESSLVLKDGAVGGAITMAAPMAFTSYNLTLPSSSGSSGQVLSTDGTGVLSWMTPISSGTGFVQNGNSFGALATLGTIDNYGLAFKVNNTERMRITSSGTIGIGTTTADSPLVVIGADSGKAVSMGGSTLFRVRDDSTNGWIAEISGTTVSAGQFSGIKLSGGYAEPSKWSGIAQVAEDLHGNSSAMALYTNETEKVRIDSAGNVGIGTTTSSTPLHVRQVANAAVATFEDAYTDNKLQVISGGSLLHTYSANDNRFLLSSNPSVDAGVTNHDFGGLLLGAASGTYSAITGGGQTLNSGARELYFWTGNNFTTAKMHIAANGIISFGGNSSAGYPSYDRGVTDAMGSVNTYWNTNEANNRFLDIAVGSHDLLADSSIRFLTQNINETEPTEKIRLSGSGRLGIGASAPTAALHLRAGASEVGGAPIKLTAGTNLTTPEDGALEYSSGTLYFTIGATRYPISLSGSTASYTGVSSISNSSGNITLSPVTTTGSVLIDSGTASTSPSSGALQVSGGVGITGALNVGAGISAQTDIITYGNLQTRGGNSVMLYNASNNAYASIQNPGATGESIMQFATNGLERMRIDNNGNVGIGTSGPLGSKLQVYNTNSGVGATVSHSFQTTTVNGTNHDYASYHLINKKVDTGVIDSGNMIGVYGNAIRNYQSTADNGTLASINGSLIQYGHYNSDAGATPVTTNAAGVVINPYFMTGTVTNAYDLLINSAATGGTVSNHYSIYQVASNTKNYFAGNVGIGTLNPSTRFDVQNPVSAGIGSLQTISRYSQDADQKLVLAVRNTNGNPFASAPFAGLSAEAWDSVSGAYGRAFFGLRSNASDNSTGQTIISAPKDIGFLVNRGTASDDSWGTFGTWAMTINTSGNVGVGTITPNARLHVVSTGAGTSGLLVEGASGDSWFPYSDGKNYIRGSTVIADTGGSVGIGTSDPLSLLHVYGTNAVLTLENGSTATGAGNTIRFGHNQTSDRTPIAEISSYLTDGSSAGRAGQLRFRTAINGGMTDRMTIDQLGNVGIGTTGPVAKLEVNGGIKSGVSRGAVSGTDLANIFGISSSAGDTTFSDIISSDFNAGGFGVVGGQHIASPVINMYDNATYDNSITFGKISYSANPATSTQPLMIIKRNGNVGIGTVTPAAKLTIANSTNFDPATNINGGLLMEGTYGGGIIFKDTAYSGIWTSSYGQILNFSASAASSFGSPYGQLLINDGKVGIGTGASALTERLEVSGNVKATSFISTSDERLKKNITQTNGLETITQLKGVSWNWKDSNKPDMGVIAQDLEKVLPQAVVTSSETGLKSVKYNALFAPLIESTKELYGMCVDNRIKNIKQDREIASLKERNRDLENEVKQLKDRLDRIEKALLNQK